MAKHKEVSCTHRRPRGTYGYGWILWLPLGALTLLWLLLTPSPAAADSHRIYVKPGAAGSGDSWTDATNLQSALSIATSGAEIWIATGIYTPGTFVTNTFQLKPGVALYGGFAGTPGSEGDFSGRDWEINPTVLSGDLAGDDTFKNASGVVTSTAGITGANAYHVVTGSGVTITAVLDGFFITAGDASGAVFDPCGDACGGGMFVENGSPTLANLTFSGNHADLDGAGLYNETSSPILTDIAFRGNRALDDGGGIYNEDHSNPILTNVTFSDNRAADGAGLHNALNSSPTLSNVNFSDNQASDAGGGLYNDTSSPILVSVAFSGNQATFDGGGMLNAFASAPSLIDVTFNGNSAGDFGGGLYNLNSSPALTNTAFYSNTAGDFGGGIYNTFSSPSLVDVTFHGNSAASNGGGLYNNSSHPTLTGGSFSGNTADANGGGLYNQDSNPTLTDVTFSTNSADANGGGLYNNNSNPMLTSVTFSDNRAGSNGGGLYNFSGSSPTLTHVIWRGNVANGDGGGLYNLGSSPTLTNAIFEGNFANDDGGGMYNSGSSPTLTNAIFTGNTATDSGGGIVNSSASNPVLTNVTLSGNTAATGGGGISNSNSGPLLQNVILWDNRATNDPSIRNTGTSAPTIRHGLVAGGLPIGSVDGGNNLDVDPLFVRPVDCGADAVCGDDPDTVADERTDDDYGDLQLQPASLAVDVGNNALLPVDSQDLDGDANIAEPVSQDLAGRPRVAAVRTPLAVVDLGAYERVNGAPLFTSTPLFTATEDAVYTYTATTSDETLGIRPLLALVKPAWSAFVDLGNGTATLSGTPQNADVGEYAVTLRVQDSIGLTTTQTFTLSVLNVNDAPTFTSSPGLTATVGAPYNYAITTADQDVGDTRILTASIRPSWMTFTPTGNGNGALDGTPATENVGSNAVVLQVQDAGGATVQQVFTVTVSAAPALTGSIVGKVVVAGVGLAGVTVTVNSETGTALAGVAATPAQNLTDAQGNYRFDDLAPGEYTLTFAPPTGFVTPTPVAVVVVAGQTTSVPDVTVTPMSGQPQNRLFLPSLDR